jgi:DNA-binding SARP family transcriptional activator
MVSPQIHFALLDRFSVTVDGRPLHSIPGRRQEELLSYLLLGGAAVYERRQLAQLIAPDLDEEQGVRLLRQQLHQLQVWLRDELQCDGLLEVSRYTVAVQRGLLSVDVLAIEAAEQALQTHHHRHPAVCRVCLTQLQAVADQVTAGPGGSSGGSSVLSAWRRQRLADVRRLFGRQLGLLTQDLVRHGDYDAALGLARRRLTLDAGDEAAQRALIEVLALLGRRAEALEQFAAARQQLQREFGLDVSPSTLLLVERIRSGQFSAAQPLRPTEPLPQLIGRAAELAATAAQIAAGDQRLISIVGIGGVGKTLFALTLATQLAEQFLDGAAVVRLEAVTTAPAMIEQIAAVAGCSIDGRQAALPQLAQQLAQRDLLLVLDNLEQIDGAATVVAALLQQTQRPLLLTTGRQPLGLLDEALIQLSGLNSDGADGAAVELFLVRARRYDQRRDWQAELADITAICRACDGLPLALELAAYRARHQSCAAVLVQLEHDLLQPAAELPVGQPLRRSVAAVLQEGWATATAGQQTLLLAAGLCLTPFNLEALQQICAGELTAEQVSAKLAVTQELGFVRRMSDGRYRLHPLVKRFLTARLADAPDLTQRLRRAYATHFSLLPAAAGLQFVNRHSRSWALAHAEQRADVIAAWRELTAAGDDAGLTAAAYPLSVFAAAGGWPTAADDLLLETLRQLPTTAACRRRLTTVRVVLFIAHQDAARVADALTELLAEPLPQPLSAETALALRQRAAIASQRGAYAEAEADLLRSCDPVPDPQLPLVTARPDGLLGLNAIRSGDLQRGAQDVLNGLISARRLADQRTEISNLNALALVSAQRGDYPAALARFEEALVVARDSGDRAPQSVILSNVANARMVASADRDRVLSELQEAIEIARETGVRGYLRTALSAIGDITFRAGAFAQAVPYLSEMLLLDVEQGRLPSSGERLLQLCEALAALGRPANIALLLSAGHAWYANHDGLRARAAALLQRSGAPALPPTADLQLLREVLQAIRT